MLLAAGASARLGTPKQLLPYKTSTLLEHALDIALQAKAHPVIAVLGANKDLIKGSLKSNKAVFVINNAWQEGMASSIRCGLQKILEIKPAIEAVIFLVCDQPYVSKKLLQQLIDAHLTSGRPIVASHYKNNTGTPALFHSSLFSAIMNLKGDAGAKKILQQYPEMVAIIDFPLGEIDIDTSGDYEKLIGK